MTGGDLNVVHAASLAVVRDHGTPRRGTTQGELDLVGDGAVAIRGGRVVAVGPTDNVLRAHPDDVETVDASGMTVLPGLVECHSHPLFAGSRHREYAERLAGASLAEVAARGGGIGASVRATRAASDHELLANAAAAYERILAGGATTLEVKSGYGLTTAEELRGLELLERSRDATPLELVITFLGAHVVPDEFSDSDAYTRLICDEMLPRARAQGIAEFHDVTCERGLFSPEQALRLLAASRTEGIPTRVHADAWAPSEGWRTAVTGGATCADHLTFTPDREIREVGGTDTIAVLLPAAELIYLVRERAKARTLIELGVPVAIATDYCSSIHATSLLHSIALGCAWFEITPGEAIVGATLNAAYSLTRAGDRGSLDVGKRGDLILCRCEHPGEIALAPGTSLLDRVVVGGRTVYEPRERADDV